MKLQSTCSAGGPIIAIPAEFAAAWRGINPPLGVFVPDGWSWGDEPEIICDYDLACFEMEDFVAIGNSGLGWLTPAGTQGMALILDMDLITHFLVTKNGGVFIRGWKDKELDHKIAQAKVDKIPASNWTDYPKEITLVDGRLFAFDSACQGFENPNDISNEDGVVVAQLTPGKYVIKYATLDDVEYISLVGAKY